MKEVLSPHKKQYMFSREVEVVTQNIVLDGLKALNAEESTITYDVIKEVQPRTYSILGLVSKRKISEKKKAVRFPLTEVTSEQLSIYRNEGVPSFVLKFRNKFYYSKITDNFNFVFSTILGEHKCAFAENVCTRLSAASDKKGGCEKVRKYSKCIENYPWITEGYETFNTGHDIFIVVNCRHYKLCSPSKKISPVILNRYWGSYEANNGNLNFYLGK